MEQMVRKQIYLEKRQDSQLKRLAQARGVSEAEIIREALDRQLNGGTNRPAHYDPEAWRQIEAFIASLRAKGPLPKRRRDWTREELYEERLSRYGRHSH